MCDSDLNGTAYGLSFMSTNIRRRLKMPDPKDVTGWYGIDFIRYDLQQIDEALGRIATVTYT